MFPRNRVPRNTNRSKGLVNIKRDTLLYLGVQTALLPTLFDKKNLPLYVEGEPKYGDIFRVIL